MPLFDGADPANGVPRVNCEGVICRGCCGDRNHRCNVESAVTP